MNINGPGIRFVAFHLQSFVVSNKIISIPRADEDWPQRNVAVTDVTFLVSVFKDEPELLPFVRHLFNTYGIVSVRQYDESKTNAFQSFKLEPHLQSRFKKMLGRPERTQRSSTARVYAFQRDARPA